MISLTNEQVVDLLTVKECISVIEGLFKDIDNTQMPAKVYMNIPNGDFRSMPAVVGDTAGIKWCGQIVHDMRRRPIESKIIINDIVSGKILAIMDAEVITAIRTAAVTGVATKYMAQEGSRVASFIGCGAQTPRQIEAVCEVMDIEHVNLFDLDRDRVIGVFREMGSLRAEVHPCLSLEECVENADIVTTLTPARGDGYLEHHMLKGECHINAVGCDAVGKRELRKSILDKIDVIVYDEWEQCSHSGEIQYYRADSNKSLFSLGDVVGGNKFERGGQTLFDATGLAIEDVATARYIYDKVYGTMCG